MKLVKNRVGRSLRAHGLQTWHPSERYEQQCKAEYSFHCAWVHCSSSISVQFALRANCRTSIDTVHLEDSDPRIGSGGSRLDIAPGRHWCGVNAASRTITGYRTGPLDGFGCG